MEFLLSFLVAVGLTWGGGMTFLWLREKFSARNRAQQHDLELRRWTDAERGWIAERQRFTQAIARLEGLEPIADAKAEASRIRDEAARLLQEAKDEAKELTGSVRDKAKQREGEAEATLKNAVEQATQILNDARVKAKEIAGSAYEVKQNADAYERAARAMKNRVEGYGNAYLVPAASLLDELGDAFEHKEGGQRLKTARSITKAMVTQGLATSCDYADESRRTLAERFVLDAFNGRVDVILSRVRSDNVGTLQQEIRDAFALVNHNGRSFRDARITPEYLAARLEELTWAAVVQELKRQELDEQRALREQIREEERARREHEKAIREAAKQEDLLRAAMEKAQAQMASASAQQRAQYEAQLAELSIKLQEAEERGRRAISMAQQTKRGHVYIISNVGSLGENVYKIGLTRRLEPLDRIRELGDSSVPFEFDVHALILSDDAPRLEHELHRHFVLNQVNKVNHRKEFFRISLSEIREELERRGLSTHWTMTAQAQQYRDTLSIEKLISSDPVARQNWLNRQLELDPTSFEVEPELVSDASDD